MSTIIATGFNSGSTDGEFDSLETDLRRLAAIGVDTVELGLTTLDLVAGGYPLSKEALRVWTMVMGSKLIKQGIRINSLHPGYVETPILGALDAQQRGALVGLHPLGRLGRADEIAHAARSARRSRGWLARRR